MTLRLIALVALLAFTHCSSISLAAEPATQPTTSRHFTYVIVHGAWGGGWAFREVDRLLTADGHKVFRPTLTGLGERVHLATPDTGLSTHVDDIVNMIQFEDLHDVVLVGHSYGGMVITGVVDRIPDRIAHVIYLDALLPEDGESCDSAFGRRSRNPATQPFSIPEWVKPNQPLPHDVPMPTKCFSEPIALKNQSAARAIPTTYVLTVDPGKEPKDDAFLRFYERAQSRGWPTSIMPGDHNVQWSRPKELVAILEKAA
jgi:pimeloyl-ACP methyl ester carboxylesterase